MENNRKPRKWNKGGRPPKKDPTIYRYTVNLSATEHTRFLSMYDESGMLSKALFIKCRIFDLPFRVIKRDDGTMQYVAKLTQFYSQFRAVGVNYNQVVKELHSHFSEKRALAMLYKLEKATIELIQINQQVIDLCQEFEKKW